MRKGDPKHISRSARCLVVVLIAQSVLARVLARVLAGGW